MDTKVMTVTNNEDELLDDILTMTIYDTGAKLTEIGWEKWGENCQDAKSALQTLITKSVLAELKTLEAQSDCIEDQCGLDAQLLRDNFLRRIQELEQSLNKPERM